MELLLSRHFSNKPGVPAGPLGYVLYIYTTHQIHLQGPMMSPFKDGFMFYVETKEIISVHLLLSVI